jgi:hypothetical protein
MAPFLRAPKPALSAVEGVSFVVGDFAGFYSRPIPALPTFATCSGVRTNTRKYMAKGSTDGN